MNTLKRKFAAGETCTFSLHYNDLELNVTKNFQPADLVVILARHKVLSVSSQVKWEPSLRSPESGFCVWHPPYNSTVKVSYKRPKNNEYPNKDCYLTLENIDSKGKRKELAKARVNLTEFRESKSRQDIQLKLKPLSSKVSKCHLNFSLEKIDTRPGLSDSVPPSPLVHRKESRSDIVSGDNVSCGTSDHTPLVQGIRTSGTTSPDPSEDDLHINKPVSLALPEDTTLPKSPEKSPEKPKPILGTSGLAASVAVKKSPVEKEVKPLPLVTLSPSNPPAQPRTVATSPSKPPSKPITLKWDDVESKTEEPMSISPRREEVNTQVSKEVIATPQGSSLSPDGQMKAIEKSQTPLAKRKEQQKPEKEILKWAQEELFTSPWIKITNLTSSWRNGIGFCSLIHRAYPDMIPITSLDSSDIEGNFELFVSACKFVGIQTDLDPLEMVQRTAPNKARVMQILEQLREGLENKKILTESDLEEWQQQRDRRKPAQHSFSFESDAPFSPTPSQQDNHQNGNHEEESKSEVEDSPSKNVRAKQLIEQALEDFDEEPALRAKIDEKKKLISDELMYLDKEEARLSMEKENIEREIRNHKSFTDVQLQKWMHLVDEKNSLIRRQMQLNIQEKEEILAVQIEDLQRRLQRFAEIDEGNKTEVMKQEEHGLLEDLVAAVNQKNELVHYLDSQEKAIAEDEEIRERIINKSDRVFKGNEECCIQ